MRNLCGSGGLIFAEESSACIGSDGDFRSTEEKIWDASGVLTDQWEGARAAGIGFWSSNHKKFAQPAGRTYRALGHLPTQP